MEVFYHFLLVVCKCVSVDDSKAIERNAYGVLGECLFLTSGSSLVDVHCIDLELHLYLASE